MLHARDEALGEVRVGRRRHDDALVGEHARRLVADIDVVAEEQRLRLRRCALRRSCGSRRWRGRTRARPRPCSRWRRARRRSSASFCCRSTGARASRQVGRVIVVQVRQEHRADGLEADALPRRARASCRSRNRRDTARRRRRRRWPVSLRSSDTAGPPRVPSMTSRVPARRGPIRRGGGGCAASGSRNLSVAMPAAPASTVRRVSRRPIVGVVHLLSPLDRWVANSQRARFRGVMPRLARRRAFRHNRYPARHDRAGHQHP